MWVGLKTVQQWSYSTVGHFNDDSITYISSLKQLGIKPGYYTYLMRESADQSHINNSKQKSTDKQKRRKTLQAIKNCN